MRPDPPPNPAAATVARTVLVVEDDAHIRFGLEEILRAEGFAVVSCPRGDEALAAHDQHRPVLVILDVMLPGQSGFDVCKTLRARGHRTPVLMLTAKGQELDKVIGLDLGADDYVTKPFGVRELTARVHALLRRADHAPTPPADHTFPVADATVDPSRYELRRGPVVEALTDRELRLLRLFAAHPGAVLSRDRLLEEVWGYHYRGTTRTLDQAIVGLRRKLGDSGDHPRWLLTVHGVGYRLAER